MATPSPAPTPTDHNALQTPKEHRLTSSPEPLAPSPYPEVHIEAPDDRTLRALAQDYKLPPAVRASLESWQKGADSLAVITALFAGVQISLVQIVVQYPDAGNSAAWRALRWFMYAGVFIDLGGTASAIAIVNMASSAPVTARSRAIRFPDSVPCQIMEEKATIHRDLLLENSETRLLREFGMSPRWEYAGWHMWISFTLGSIFIFTSLAVWIWLTETKAVAAVLMLIIIPAIYPIIHVAS